MKYILPYHLGSGNRGCEGICRGISKILGIDKTKMLLFNMTKQEYVDDCILGLDKIATLKYKGNMLEETERNLFKILKKIGNESVYNEFISNYYVSNMSKGDVFLMTGGDIYCYKNGGDIPNLIAKKAKQKNIKSVIYCASFQNEFLTDSICEGLKNYDLIITRETISHTLLNHLNIENSIIPDPAFTLTSVPIQLPQYFKGKVLGLNFSEFTNNSTMFIENIKFIVDYCCKHGIQVCLIPHVFWKYQDDRETMKSIKKYFGDKIHYLDTKSMSYLEIRYVISQCAYFIGGRTHSMISAYCEGVPAIALGYSNKSIGIAADIGLPEYTVVDSKNLKSNLDIVLRLERLVQEENKIKEIYRNNMPKYIARAYGAKQLLENI